MLHNCPYCNSKPKILCINKIWQVTCMNIECLKEFTIRNSDKLQCIKNWNIETDELGKLK